MGCECNPVRFKTLSIQFADPSWILSITRRKDLSEYAIATSTTIVGGELVFFPQIFKQEHPKLKKRCLNRNLLYKFGTMILAGSRYAYKSAFC